ETTGQVKSPSLAAYAARYLDIYDDFISHVQSAGVEIDSIDYTDQVKRRLEGLKQKSAVVRNDDKSVVVNAISPACEACRTGVSSATFFISLECPRSCFFCFNPNQAQYDYFSQHQRNVQQELCEMHAAGAPVDHLALTGGEPLLHKPEAIAFFRTADERFPSAYKRLYTSGDLVDADVLRALGDAHLDEIRFSLRLHDGNDVRCRLYDRMALARSYIPNVMVEMPVLPDTLETMKEVLVELDRLGITGINLLEFCFPWHNAEIYRRKNYQIKRRPFRVLYNYWYAGGLPVSRSELECLDLIEFALDKKLELGVHYCSLENKQTGQIFRQNAQKPLARTAYFSEKDFFVKSAKVFGPDVATVRSAFDRAGDRDYQVNRDYDYLEFHVGKIDRLEPLDLQVAISYNVMEAREDGQYLRELDVGLTTPREFDLAADV
ncbi:MAG: radical SAM protein, partial [Chloroflexi bacterium]|nr:radical SAM protein [Chloroflexota bacterium]